MRRAFAFGVYIAFVVACKASASNSSASPSLADAGSSNNANDDASANPDAATSLPSCEPLNATPLSFQDLFGVGKDSNGVLYAADEEASSIVVFRSNNGAFYRKRVTSAVENGTGANLGFSAALLQVDDEIWTGETLVGQEQDGIPSMSLEVSGTSTETALTSVDPSTIAAMPVFDLPPRVIVVADDAYGETIVVSVDMAHAGTLHLFHGAASHLVERAITQNDGDDSASWYVFNEGTSTMTFQITFNTYTDDAGEDVPGPPTGASLSVKGGSVTPFTVRTPTPTSLPGVTFQCL